MLFYLAKLVATDISSARNFEEALGVVCEPTPAHVGVYQVPWFHVNQQNGLQGGVIGVLQLLAAMWRNGSGFIPVGITVEFARGVPLGTTLFVDSSTSARKSFRRVEARLWRLGGEGQVDPVEVVATASVSLAAVVGPNPSVRAVAASRSAKFRPRAGGDGGRGIARFEGFGGMNTFCHWLGMRHTSVVTGHIAGQIEIVSGHRDHIGNIHPGVLLAALDSISGDAVLTKVSPLKYRWVPSVFLQVSFFPAEFPRQAQPVVYYGKWHRSRQQREGNILHWSNGEIRLESGVLLARAENVSVAVPKK